MSRNLPYLSISHREVLEALIGIGPNIAFSRGDIQSMTNVSYKRMAEIIHCGELRFTYDSFSLEKADVRHSDKYYAFNSANEQIPSLHGIEPMREYFYTTPEMVSRFSDILCLDTSQKVTQILRHET